MSINRNRKKLNQGLNSKHYKCILLDELFPLYWDEGCKFYGKNQKWMSYKIREFKTWKHNRKTQYKMKKIKDAL